MRLPEWFLGSLVQITGVVERGLAIAAAAASVQQYTHGSIEEPSRVKTHDEWASEVVARADALRRASRRA
jgi:hypothetical protein